MPSEPPAAPDTAALQRRFDEILLTPLEWPGRTMRLGRDALLDYRNRPASGTVAIAELFHQNSKLHPAIRSELAAPEESAALRAEYVRRRAVLARASGTAALPLPDGVARVLRTVARACAPELFYAIEIRLVAGRELAGFEPVSGRTSVLRRLDDLELADLRRALFTGGAAGDPAEEVIHVLVTASMARNDLLLSARGYRRTLVEAGQVVQAIVASARRSGLRCEVIHEFWDRVLDDVAQVDGVEEGTLVVLRLG